MTTFENDMGVRKRAGTAPRRPLIIDQDGREVPEMALRDGPGGGASFAFAGVHLFGDLTREQRLVRLETVASLLDIAFVVPGTRIRYGIDGLIGLIPVVGDIVATALSLWVVREARALGAPWHIIARMLGNVAVDGLVGAVPLIGDAFDVMFRANIRNQKILKRWLARQR